MTGRNDTIPLVDLRDFESNDEQLKMKFVEKLVDAFHNIGFVGVTGHGIPQDLIDNFYESAKRYFALPSDIKMKYAMKASSGERGYTSFGGEQAKGSNTPDLKEFFQFGGETEDTPDHIRNPKVTEVPEFVELGNKLFSAFEERGRVLLCAIGIHLGLPEDYFTKITKNGDSIFRAIHYPPITSEPGNAIRAAQHEDINFITLLVGASAGGLQLKTQSGEWKDVIPEQNEIVVNVGDMLQRLTNKYLKSTTHRVINPPKEEWHLPRLSIPFFLQPLPDTNLKALESCFTPENPEHFPPITAMEYLQERLNEIKRKV